MHREAATTLDFDPFPGVRKGSTGGCCGETRAAVTRVSPFSRSLGWAAMAARPFHFTGPTRSPTDRSLEIPLPRAQPLTPRASIMKGNALLNMSSDSPTLSPPPCRLAPSSRPSFSPRRQHSPSRRRPVRRCLRLSCCAGASLRMKRWDRAAFPSPITSSRPGAVSPLGRLDSGSWA